MKFRTLLSFLVVVIALIGCKDDDTAGTSKAKPAAEAKYHYAVAMTGVV